VAPHCPAKKGSLIIKHTPLGDAISNKFKTLIAAPAGMFILRTVPGSCGQPALDSRRVKFDILISSP
jgi:hypothetical protein